MIISSVSSSSNRLHFSAAELQSTSFSKSLKMFHSHLIRTFIFFKAATRINGIGIGKVMSSNVVGVLRMALSRARTRI